MPVLFVARSAKLARWASDVGFGRHVYKVGVSEADPKTLAASGWAGESDWKIVGREEVAELSEAEALERLSRKEKSIDPTLYPKLKGASGMFRVAADHVENHIIVGRALAGDTERLDLKLKPADFAMYLIHNATRAGPARCSWSRRNYSGVRGASLGVSGNASEELAEILGLAEIAVHRGEAD